MTDISPISILFFGTTEDSIIVAEAVHSLETPVASFKIAAIVTQPPQPVGRKQIITPTPLEQWAKKQEISVVSFATNPQSHWLYQNENQVIDTLQTFKADLLLTAVYGQRIPWPTIEQAKFGGINVHPSLLPRWRGAYPVPWAILAGDHQTGVTIITLAKEFDEGKILGQKKVPLTDHDLPQDIRTSLFTAGAQELRVVLPEYIHGNIKGEPQDEHRATFARRLTRNDGYIPWKLIQQAIQGRQEFNDIPEFLNKILKHSDQPVMLLPIIVERAIRGLAPWPGVWTEVLLDGTPKRLKILTAHIEGHHHLPNLVIDTVQLEGKNPITLENLYSKITNNQ